MDINSIGELIRTQDNRITDQPMFIVQENERIYGMDSDYSDNYEWFDDVACCVISDQDEIRETERLHESDELNDAIRKVYYKDHWVFVTACFTEQGCKDYLKTNGHNHGQTRIYGWGTRRNAEFQAVRNHLIEQCS